MTHLVSDLCASLYRLMNLSPQHVDHNMADDLPRRSNRDMIKCTSWWYMAMLVVAISPLIGSVYKIIQVCRARRKIKSRQKPPVTIGGSSRDAYLELKRQRSKMGRTAQIICKKDQGLPRPPQSAGKETTPRNAPTVIKLHIKRSPYSVEAFHESKKKFLFSLMSPAKQPKRVRRRADRNGETAQVSQQKEKEQQTGSSAEQLYKTAKTDVEKTDCEKIPPVCVRHSQPFHRAPQPEENNSRRIVAEQTEPTRSRRNSRRRKSPANHAHHTGDQTGGSPEAKSPTKKKSRKKQQRRSIFSKSGLNVAEREPEQPPDEAPVPIAKPAESKLETPFYPGKQTPTKARPKRRGAVSGRGGRSGRSQAASGARAPDQTECPAQELRDLIQQVELEQAKRSVSPRQSETFVAANQRELVRLFIQKQGMSQDKAKLAAKSRSITEKAPAISPTKCRSPRPCVSPRPASPGPAAGDTESAPRMPSGSMKCVSGSVLSRIASISSCKSAGRGKPGKTPPKISGSRSPVQQTDQHRMFVKAARGYSLKTASPVSRSYSRMGMTGDLEITKHDAGHPVLRHGIIDRPLPARRSSLRKPQTSAFNRKNQHRLYQPAQTKNDLFPAISGVHNLQTRVEACERFHVPAARGPGTVVRAEGSVSTSLSSHYSFLGCIDPSHSAKTRNASLKTLGSLKNNEVFSSLKKNKSSPQPIEGYILNSKTPIANTLLLCRSGITTTYENWTNEKARGPGVVRACHKASSENRFPSLSSYLDYLERKAAAHGNSLLAQGKNGKKEHAKQRMANPLQNSISGKEQTCPSPFTPQEISKNAAIEMRERETKSEVLQESKRERNNLAPDKSCTEPKLLEEPKTNIKWNNLIAKENVHHHPNGPNVLKENDKTQKNSETKKQISPNAKTESKGRAFRPKLRFRYLPLTKQPLPLSSPSNTKREVKVKSLDRQEKNFATPSDMAGSKIKELKRQDKAGTKQNLQTPTLMPKASNKSAQQQHTQMKNDVGEPEKTTRVQPIHYEVTKPVVVNLRKFSKQRSGPYLMAKKSPKTLPLKSPEKTQTMSNVDTSASLDLQSMFEMAKTVLKKNKSKSKNEKDLDGRNQESKAHGGKSDDQASVCSQCKYSPSAGKDDTHTRNLTPKDRSYTHLYKINESRGLRPWRTTKAFTNRLKLMLQKNNEHCMNKKTQKSPDPKKDRRAKKAYVVHKANPSKIPLCLKSEAGSCSARTLSALKGGKSLKNKKLKENEILEGSNVNAPFKNGKAPMLRTEALARKRGKTVENTQRLNFNFRAKRKRFKCTGSPLLLSNTQLYHENGEETKGDLVIQSAITQFDLGSPESSRKSPRSMPFTFQRGNRVVGMDPAQVAKMHQRVQEHDILRNTQSETVTSPFSRKSQVQSDLSALLNKIKVRTIAEGSHLDMEIPLDHEMQVPKKEQTEESTLFGAYWKDAGIAKGEQTPADVRASPGCSENTAAVSGKSRPQAQSSRHSETTLLIHSELDAEPSSAALKLLLQCARSKFHSMPQLSAPRLQSPSITETTPRESLCEQPSSKELSDDGPGLRCKPMSKAGQLKGRGTKSNGNLISSKTKLSKANKVSKSEDTGANKGVARESTSTSNTKTSALSFSENTKSSLERSIKRRRRCALSGSQLSKVSKSRESNLTSEISKSNEGTEPKISESKQSSLRQGADDSCSGNFEHTETDTSQCKKPRNTAVNPGAFLKKTKKSTPLANKKSLHKYKNETHIKTASHNTIEKDKETETNIDKCMQRKSSENISSAPAKKFSPHIESNISYVEQSPQKNEFEVTKAHAAVLCNESAIGVENYYQVEQKLQTNQQYQHQPNTDGAAFPSHMTSMPLNFWGSPKKEMVMISESRQDFEAHLFKKSMDFSPSSLAERGATSSSGYGTLEVSSNTAVSRLADSHSQLRSKFIEQPRRQTDFEFGQGSPEQRSCIFSTRATEAHTFGQLSGKKALSHISEESNYSDVNEVNIELASVENYRNEQSKASNEAAEIVNHFSSEKGNFGTVNTMYVSQDFQQRSESSKDSRTDRNISEEYDEMLQLDISTEAPGETLLRVTIEDTFGARVTDLEVGQAAKPVSELESPGRWFKSPLQGQKQNKSLQAQAQRQQGGGKDRKISVGSALEKRAKVSSDGRSWLNEIPVTVVYTNQNSDIPDLSFTNEDEYSLDSWTQNSLCMSKKSLECGPNSNEQNCDQTYCPKQDSGDIVNEDLVHESTTRHCTPSVRGSCEKTKTEAGEKCDSMRKVNEISGNDKSNSNDPFRAGKDLESLLDFALDKASFNWRLPATSRVGSKPLFRKARVRRLGRSVIGSKREVSPSVNRGPQIPRDCQNKRISMPPGPDTKPNWKLRLATLNDDTDQESADRTCACVSASKAVEMTSATTAPDILTPQTQAVETEHANDEQTLQRILKQVAVQPFEIKRNRKSRRDEVKTEDVIVGNQRVQPSCMSVEIGICEDEQTASVATNSGIKHQVVVHAVSPQERIESHNKHYSSSERKALQIDRAFKNSDSLPSNSYSSAMGDNHRSVQEMSGQENVPQTVKKIPHKSIQDACNAEDKKQQEKNEEEEDHGKGFSHKEPECYCKTQNNHGAGSLNQSQVNITPPQQPAEQKTQGIAGRGDAPTGSPGPSNSSSIVLSWVGSQNGSDGNDDVLSGAGLQSPSAALNSQPLGSGVDTTCSYFQDTESKSHYLFGDMDPRDKKKEDYKLNSDLLSAQSSNYRFNHALENSELFSSVGPLKQSNLNENKTKTEPDVSYFHSEVMEDSSAGAGCDENIVSESLSISLGGFYSHEKNGNKSYLTQTSKRGIDDEILDQESYLYNLMKNMGWNDEMPREGWGLAATEEKLTAPYPAERTAPLVLSGHDPPGEGDSRCGYVISAWTNQRQYGELDADTSRPGASRQTAAARNPARSRLSVVSNPMLGREQCSSERNQGMSLPRISQSNPREHLGHDFENRPHTGTNAGFTRDIPTERARFDQQGSRLGKRNTPEISGDLTDSSRLGVSCTRDRLREPGTWGADCETGKSRTAAPSLEQHLRSRFGDPDLRAQPTIPRAASVTVGSRRQLRSPDGRLSVRSDGANLCCGDKSPSQPSLDWYRPQSMSSSNSISASHTAEVVDPLRSQESNSGQARAQSLCRQSIEKEVDNNEHEFNERDGENNGREVNGSYTGSVGNGVTGSYTDSVGQGVNERYTGSVGHEVNDRGAENNRQGVNERYTGSVGQSQ
ncbi:hypothetical protein EGW08_007982 [Elysia chlorotica]|uniref:Uncharacterized protein n=1 Tax=Elysia chlorotica TaxID=188477 RepID=A0A3S1BB77_ELYCH|nr:hypothetical protein EGW08_007982 [Elysia chlorotica]